MQKNSNNKQKVDFIDFSLQYIQVGLKITQFLGALPTGKAFYPTGKHLACLALIQ